ncbi:hypothetical protein ABZ616_31125 [Streptomyces noursei]|uniref:hypothetical protein n=1 Tax=Streptomyces noursei TaxID=1971 RepID=UPI0033F9840A
MRCENHEDATDPANSGRLIDHGAALVLHRRWNTATNTTTKPYDLRHHALGHHQPEMAAANAEFTPLITTELLHEVLSTVPDTWLTDEPGFTTTTDVRNAYITHLTPEPQPPPTGSRPNSPHRPNGQAADEGDALLLAGLRRVRHGSGPGAPVRHPLCSAVLPCG